MADPIQPGSAGMQNWLNQLLLARQTQGGLPPMAFGNFEMPPPMPTRNPQREDAPAAPEPSEMMAAMQMLGGPTAANAAPVPVPPNPAAPATPMAPGTATTPAPEAPRFAPGPHAIPPEGPGLSYGGSTGFGGIPQMRRSPVIPTTEEGKLNYLGPLNPFAAQALANQDEDIGAALTGSGGSPAPAPFRRRG